jgi:hypothetical protein
VPYVATAPDDVVPLQKEVFADGGEGVVGVLRGLLNYNLTLNIIFY